MSGVSGNELLAFIERVQVVHSQRDDLNDDLSDLYKEMKSSGFETKIVKKIIAQRRMDPGKRAEQEALLDLYLNALGSVDQ